MSKLLKTLNQYPAPTQAGNCDALNALALASRPETYLASLQQGHLSTAAQQADDMRLAGTIMSSILECELITFLNDCRERGLKNYRNGYLPRSISTPSGTLHCVVSRDRLGMFDPQLVHSYSRDLSLDPADLLSLGVSYGYSDEEIYELLKGLYATVGEHPKTLHAMSTMLAAQCRRWNDAPIPTWLPMVIGWTRLVEHRNGLQKRIIGLKAIGPDGNLFGLRAVAGSDEETYALTDHFMEEVTHRYGLLNPSYFAFPEEFEPMADAAKHYWGYTRLIPVNLAYA